MTSKQLLIVSGASSGIGAALAAAAQADGATVATMSRRDGPGHHLSVDLADAGRWSEVVAWMGERIDAAIADGVERISFVHNAGTLEPIGFAAEVDGDAYATNVLVNSASGQVLGAGFLRHMAGTDRGGLLVMMSSGAGKNPYPGWSSYCSAKAALDMWVRTAAIELDERNSPVTVAAIAPGVVATSMQDLIRTMDESAFPNVERFRDMKEAGQLSSPDEVGADYWALCRDGGVEQGQVASITDFG